MKYQLSKQDIELANRLGLPHTEYVVEGQVFAREIVAGEFKTRFISSVYEYIQKYGCKKSIPKVKVKEENRVGRVWKGMWKQHS